MWITRKSRKRNPAMLDTTMRALQIFKVFNTYPYEVQDRSFNWLRAGPIRIAPRPPLILHY